MNWLHRGARPLLLALLGAICIITGSAVLAFGPNIAVVASAASTTSATHHYDLPTQHAMRRTGAEPAAAQQVTSRAVVRLLTRATTSSVAAEGATPAIKAGTAGGETAGKAFPQSVKDAALAENPGTCVYCRMGTSTPRIDHAIPKSRGGNATLDNAQTTCPWCNGSKNNRDFPMNPPPGYEGGWPPPWWSPVE